MEKTQRVINYIRNIISRIKKVGFHFPLALFLCTISAALLTYLQLTNGHDTQHVLKPLLALIIGIPFAISTRLATTVYPKVDLMGPLIVLLIMAIWLFLHIDVDIEKPIYQFRFYIANILGLLLISWIMFWPKKLAKLITFTKFNTSMFYHVLEILLTNLIIFIGYTLILISLDRLFHIDIDSDWYTVGLTWILGWFSILRIISAISFDAKGMEVGKMHIIVGRYILIPFSVIYLIILYFYGIKIVSGADPTSSMVSGLTIWFFFVGILTYLLNYLWAKKEDNPMSSIYVKWFFNITLPLSLLLLWTTYRHIVEQGITPPNYYLALLSLWLLGISVYFLLSKSDDIRWIPVSLFFIGLISLIGPWSFDNATAKNQYQRLIHSLEEKNLLDDENNQNLNDIKNQLDKKDFSSLSWLKKMDKKEWVKTQQWDIDDLLEMNIPFRPNYRNQSFVNLSMSDENGVISTKKYDYLIILYSNRKAKINDKYSISFKVPATILWYEKDKEISFDISQQLSIMEHTSQRTINLDTLGHRISINVQSYHGVFENDTLVQGGGVFQVLFRE